ncbi:hypothetical protein NQ318_011046 [Aromia moschata]|uniref:J domain-containing protein n=1 Tax=Aromia moschata TaxID=1265417 RepID=A0AAV8YU06_9CUCU|nr:hypothetical protein NQ318_011046 [Aromia moschata]
MGIDYYGILQISKNSTDLQIKKAYRNMALEFNPEILKLIMQNNDPLRRAVFDQYGEEGLKKGIPTANNFIPAYHYHGDPMLTYKDFLGPHLRMLIYWMY